MYGQLLPQKDITWIRMILIFYPFGMLIVQNPPKAILRICSSSRKIHEDSCCLHKKGVETCTSLRSSIDQGRPCSPCSTPIFPCRNSAHRHLPHRSPSCCRAASELLARAQRRVVAGGQTGLHRRGRDFGHRMVRVDQAPGRAQKL